MALPDAVEYGTVSWRAVSAVADGADADGNPDAVPVTGTVTFSPSASIFLVPAGVPPITVFATSVQYTLDRTGVLRDIEGRELITLVATDSAGLTPTDWTWTCSYRLNNGAVRGSFSFALPAGTHVDLTAVAPVAASNGASIIQGPAGSVEVGTVTTLAAGAPATVDNSGTDTAAVFDFGIPQGPEGDIGPAGTITSATATGLAAGAAPTVTLGGTASARTFAFGIPKGDKGDTGEQGPSGSTDPEVVRDTIAAALRAGTNVTITVDDVADTITISAATGSTADATTTSKGVVQLAGDLGGTADAPTVPGLDGKANAIHQHGVPDLTATGIPDASTFLRGDNQWAIPPGSDIAAPATILRLVAPDGGIWDLTAANDGVPVTTAAPVGALGATADLRLSSPDGKRWSYTVANDGVLVYKEIV